MSENRKARVKDYRAEYATHSDFCDALTHDVNVLYLLAFLLTASHADAELCVCSGAEKAFESNRVFRGWVTSWIRRNLIISAIRLVFDISNREPRKPDRSSSGPELGSAVDAITHLADLDRFVFVMLVLERYSVHECSLLLGVTPRKIIESRISALRSLPTVTPVVNELSFRSHTGHKDAGLWDGEDSQIEPESRTVQNYQSEGLPCSASDQARLREFLANHSV